LDNHSFSYSHAHYNGESFAVHHTDENRASKELVIKVDTSNGTARTIAERDVIDQSCLMTRFELGSEEGDVNIEGIVIEKTNVITSEDTYVLRLITSSDYRIRVGGREQNFYFIVENCMASIHVEETKIGMQKFYYLVVKNMV